MAPASIRHGLIALLPPRPREEKTRSGHCAHVGLGRLPNS